MTGREPKFDADRNLLAVGERRLVFHCHHYNLFLQRSIEDMFGEGGVEMQISAAKESARKLLTPILSGTREACLTQAAAFFAENGFGHADVSELGPMGGHVALATSHYALGFRAKWGAAKRPICLFPTGFWAGAVAVASRLAPERVVARETQCAATGADRCIIDVEVR